MNHDLKMKTLHFKVKKNEEDLNLSYVWIARFRAYRLGLEGSNPNPLFG